MKRFAILLILLISFLGVNAQKSGSQTVDSLRKVVVDSVKKILPDTAKSKKEIWKQVFGVDSIKRKDLPRVALYRSLILPGWGQRTNKQTWLIPIIYGGVATGGFFIWQNNTNYLYFRNNLRQLALNRNPILAISTVDYINYLEKIKNTQTTIPTLTQYIADLKSKETITVDFSENKGFVLGREGIQNYNSQQLDNIVKQYRRWRDLTIVVMVLGWGLQAIQANAQAHLRTFDTSDNISFKIEPDFQNTFGSASIGMKFKVQF